MGRMLILVLIIWSNLMFGQKKGEYTGVYKNESTDFSDSTEFYVHSEIDSLYRLYYENGNLYEVGSFELRRTKIFKYVFVQVGLWKIFYEEGGLKSKGVYVDGNKDLIWEYYTKMGALFKVQSFNSGILMDERIYNAPMSVAPNNK